MAEQDVEDKATIKNGLAIDEVAVIMDRHYASMRLGGLGEVEGGKIKKSKNPSFNFQYKNIFVLGHSAVGTNPNLSCTPTCGLGPTRRGGNVA